MNDLEFEGSPLPRPRDFLPDPPPPQNEADGLGIQVVNWRDLPDSEAAVTWAALDAWARWFIHRYNIPPAIVPDCWWKHGTLVEELSALHTLWLVSFDPLDTGAGPITFHEHLEQSVPRLRRVAESCRNYHQEPAARLLTRDRTEWSQWVTASHARFTQPAEDPHQQEEPS